MSFQKHEINFLHMSDKIHHEICLIRCPTTKYTMKINTTWNLLDRIHTSYNLLDIMHHDIWLIEYTINLIDKQNTPRKKKYTIEIVLIFWQISANILWIPRFHEPKENTLLFNRKYMNKPWIHKTWITMKKISHEINR